MARIRTVKPEFWRNELLSAVSAEAALLAIGLLNVADDEGYFKANVKLIEADIFLFRDLSRTVPVLMQELYDIGYIRVFLGSDDRNYGHVVNFLKHQTINKPKPSKIKELELVPYEYGIDTVLLPGGKERKGKERKGKEKQEKEKSPSAPVGEKTPDSISLIIDHLNQKAGTDYRSTTKATRSIINARLSEGFTVDDCKRVIDNRVVLCLHDGEMKDFLRPSTLFRASKFEGYLNSAAMGSTGQASELTEEQKRRNAERAAEAERLIEEALK